MSYYTINENGSVPKAIEALISSGPIRIISGEGEIGSIETYNGKRSIRAIKIRLTRERCGGDRWAKAQVFSHADQLGDVYVDIETGEYCA